MRAIHYSLMAIIVCLFVAVCVLSFSPSALDAAYYASGSGSEWSSSALMQRQAHAVATFAPLQRKQKGWEEIKKDQEREFVVEGSGDSNSTSTGSAETSAEPSAPTTQQQQQQQQTASSEEPPATTTTIATTPEVVQQQSIAQPSADGERSIFDPKPTMTTETTPAATATLETPPTPPTPSEETIVITSQPSSSSSLPDEYPNAHLLKIGKLPFVRHYSPKCTLRIPSSKMYPHVFITVKPNHGAGIGHQFGEWGYGPWLAMRYNLNYIHARFERNGRRWESFLGFGNGEDTEEDLEAAYEVVHKIEYDIDSFWKDEYGSGEKKGLQTWMHDQLNLWKMKAPHIFSHNSTNPATGRTEALYFRMQKFHVESTTMLCDPQLNLILRKKHCMRSVLSPMLIPASYENRMNLRRMAEDFKALEPPIVHPAAVANGTAKPRPSFWDQSLQMPLRHAYVAADQNSKVVVVAVHMRCGKSCFSEFRSTPPPIILHSIKKIHRSLSPILANEGKTIHFDLFAEPPVNVSAEIHFAPILRWLQVEEVSYATHFYLSAMPSLHRIIVADVILGAQSSFSFLSAYLHSAVNIGVIRGCSSFVSLHKPTGEFDEAEFVKVFLESRQLLPRFESVDECNTMKEIPKFEGN